MTRYLLRRIPVAVVIVVASSIVAFILPRLAPGDPAAAIAGSDLTAEQLEAIRGQFDLDRPLVEQYWLWVTNALHGDFGESYASRYPVSELITSRLGSTIELTVAAAAFTLVLVLVFGIVGGSTQSRLLRAAIDGWNTVFLAAPPFLTGLVLILLFGIAIPVLPISGEVPFLSDPVISVQYLVLPGIALALPQAAIVSRQLQSSMRATRREDFVDLAIAKGVPRRRIILRHIVRNSSGPALVLFGLRLGELLAGAVIIEAIFTRPGLGQLAVVSVLTNDYFVIQALIVMAVAVAVALQLLTEIGLAGLDPRIRLEA